MRRRILLAAGAAALGAAVPPSRAQQRREPPLVGYLFERPLSPTSDFQRFRERLAELGWRDGTELRLEFRSFATAEDGVREAAALVARGARALVAQAPRALDAARFATATIPIVAFYITDPTALGLAESLARPTRNVTGFTWDAGPEHAGKDIEILREIAVDARHITVLHNPDNPAQHPRFEAMRGHAARLGLGFRAIAATAVEIEAGLEAVGRLARGEPLVVFADPLTISHREPLSARLLGARAVALVTTVDWRFEGCVLGSGARTRDQPALAAEYVARILRGAAPADLPFVRPVRFELLVNLRAARAVGVAVPPLLLARADEVME